MKSRITIDFKGLDAKEDTGKFEPVIRATVEDSEDPRDGLIKAFFENLGADSSWLSVDIHSSTEYGNTKKNIIITPIAPADLAQTIKIMISKINDGDPVKWFEEQLRLAKDEGYVESILDSKN